MTKRARWSGLRQAAAEPANPEDFTNPARQFWRPDHLELVDQSLNDWYSWGVLVGLGIEEPITDAVATRCFTYAGKGACHSQYLQGIRDGRAMKRASPSPVLALVSEDPPEESGDRGPDPTPQ